MTKAGGVEQPSLPLLDDVETQREMLLARWHELTRVILPGMAASRCWPIRYDHCFMRVCLDTALGAPWHTVIRRPAIRHLTVTQLSAAIAIAEGVVSNPDSLDALNRQSIRWRTRFSHPEANKRNLAS
jgi:hypothetical protein